MNEVEDTLLGIAETLMKQVSERWKRKATSIKRIERIQKLNTAIAMVEILRLPKLAPAKPEKTVAKPKRKK